MRNAQISLSGGQRDVLGRYLDHFQDGTPETRDPLKLPLVLSGEKPGTVIRPQPWDDGLAGDITDFFNRLGLVHGQIPPTTSYYVSHDQQLINSLSDTVCNKAEYHRTLGQFFGYPDDAVDCFIEQDLADRTQPEDLVADGVFDADELAFTDFVFYVPVDSIDGYERAIEDGKTNYQRLMELAGHWELPAITSMADSVHRYCADQISTPEAMQ